MGRPYQEVAIHPLEVENLHFDGISKAHPSVESRLPEPFAVYEEDNNELDTVNAWRVTEKHGRSVEVDTGMTAFMHDGHLFTSVTLKGNIMTDVYPALNSRINEFQLNGLVTMTPNELERMIKGSSVLLEGGLEKGVETEAPLKVMKPRKIRYEGKWFDEQDFRNALVQDIDGRTDNSETVGETTHLFQITEDRKQSFQDWLNSVDFLVIERAQPVPERLADLRALESYDDFMVMMERTFRYINMKIQTLKDLKSSGEHEIFKESDTEDLLSLSNGQADIDRYFADILPQQIAINIARIHNKQLIHRFPHGQNILLSGGIVDNDSLRGAPLGDKPINQLSDTNSVLYDMRYLLQDSTNRITNVLRSVQDRGFVSKHPDLYQMFDMNLLQRYCIERWGDDALRKELPITLLYLLKDTNPILNECYSALNIHGVHPDMSLIEEQ